MNRLQIIYQLMRVKDRIPHYHNRYIFLHDRWGYKQTDIAICEGKSQPYISNVIRKARQEITNDDIMKINAGHFSIDDIKLLHYQPREIINDYELIAFVKDVLQLEVTHPLFHFWGSAHDYKRIAALASLGIQPSFIARKFGKSNSNVSMIIKRNKEVSAKELPQRYDNWGTYMVKPIEGSVYVPKFITAGGIKF